MALFAKAALFQLTALQDLQTQQYDIYIYISYGVASSPRLKSCLLASDEVIGPAMRGMDWHARCAVAAFGCGDCGSLC